MLGRIAAMFSGLGAWRRISPTARSFFAFPLALRPGSVDGEHECEGEYEYDSPCVATPTPWRPFGAWGENPGPHCEVAPLDAQHSEDMGYPLPGTAANFK